MEATGQSGLFRVELQSYILRQKASLRFLEMLNPTFQRIHLLK
jgi:hypothetical protein